VGFGVSGSAAIIFLGVLVCTGTLYTAAAGSAERLVDAEQDNHERILDRRNTDVDVASARFNATTGVLVVRANNTGATTLSVDATTLLVDNEYAAVPPANSRVDGNAATNLWAPGETLEVEVSATAPARVKLITGAGVAATEPVVVS
jgi:flagellar protein FlaF